MDTNINFIEDAEDVEDITFDEANKLTKTDEAVLARAEKELEDAKLAYELQINGVPMRDSEEGRRLLKKVEEKYQPALIAAEEAAEEIANSIHRNMERIRSLTADSQYVLTPDEYHLVEARRNIIKEDSANLTYGRLVGAVQYAILQDDRPAMFLYGRYVAERLAYGESNGSWADSAAKQEKSELQRMLRSIDRKLKDPTIAPLHDKAGSILVRAGELGRAASDRRVSSQTYAWQVPGEVLWDGE